LETSGRLQGVLVDVDELNPSQRYALKNAFYGLDLERCRVMDHNRKALGAIWVILMFLGGLAMIGVGSLIYRKWLDDQPWS
jgi:hypothetical protein